MCAMNAASAIGGLISEVINGTKDTFKDIYLETRQNGIQDLDKEEFDKEWIEATKPYYEKCAAMVFDTIGKSAPELKDRVVATIKDPEIIGYPDMTIILKKMTKIKNKYQLKTRYRI